MNPKIRESLEKLGSETENYNGPDGGFIEGYAPPSGTLFAWKLKIVRNNGWYRNSFHTYSQIYITEEAAIRGFCDEVFRCIGQDRFSFESFLDLYAKKDYRAAAEYMVTKSTMFTYTLHREWIRP